MDEDFLLETKTAKKLYEAVEKLPIIDYHCHLYPNEISENKRFENITEIWLKGDHYKWRIMRANGVNEKYITGDATDYEKFEKWAQTVEEAIGNPLYHWTHLELKRYFNYNGLLNKNTAREVFEHCNNIIKSDEFCVEQILKDFNVEAICTTDDPIDTLKAHIDIKNNLKTTKVLPTYRPSQIMNIELDGWASYVEKLSNISNCTIKCYDDIVESLNTRITYFNEKGCKLSDHALDPAVFCLATKEELNKIVASALNGEKLSVTDIEKYKTAILLDQSKKYYAYGWAMQLHMGCIRNTNTLRFEQLGADTGFDCIDDRSSALPLVKLLNELNKENTLPKTIIYSLNPNEDDVIATICACFQDGNTKGKIQFGSAWWFNDHIDGMEKQMKALANNGMLARFVGMLTDSRSFLSYVRHEYFRRVLCNLIGNWVENGEYPDDMEQLVKIASNICYYNAKEYFLF